ncbi:MAG: 1-deoxy-D-xylulose-5-phosphate reductoisomerase [Halanaerobiales bacterium]|nr:1-deoxy-D-xylulose-5-phosphate reductoisomerase [Halanaerobiales bacterium]
MKRLVLLGSTGSIGTQTLSVLDHLAEEWEVVGLSAHTNIDLLEKQAHRYQPTYLAVMNETLAKELEYRLTDLPVQVLTGMEGINYLAGEVAADLVINALVGAVGLKPTITALKAGHRLGLANKESLVIGGEIVQEYLAQILPIDSEHNAIFQVLAGHNRLDVQNIILTASGGPFRTLPLEEFDRITVADALHHPNWEMGGKITIDSATLMNKGLEVIEAHWLFKQPYQKIKVIVHPESIIHSMVEFIDRSIMAELGVADMRIPIQYVLTYPERKKSPAGRLDLLQFGQLNFQEPDLKRFPALRLAYQAGQAGGTMPVVLNAANEIAVAAFLQQKIPFRVIPALIEKVLERHNNKSRPGLGEILQADRWARDETEEVMS